MALSIEDYAMIGNCHTAALVGRDGSIDWLCFPRFDSEACFAALLGTSEHGRWLLTPAGVVTCCQRRYRENTLILESELTTASGSVRIIDFMPLSLQRNDLVRVVEGLQGDVAMLMELVIRFDFGCNVPWVRQIDGVLSAIAGPHRLEIRADVSLTGKNLRTIAEFTVKAGERVAFSMNYRPSHKPALARIDPHKALSDTESRWVTWSRRCKYRGRYHTHVVRSLIVLKALTYQPTGGIVAAPTTSLPEHLGGVRNWDYRYCWLRDATFTLNALLLAGYRDEALAWCEWLLRSSAGNPQDLQILYSVAGDRRLREYEIDWLPGYRDSAPVRIGNAASTQFQLDVYGEVMDTLHLARLVGLAPNPAAWCIQRALLRFLEAQWDKPDEGIWEVRGPRRHFTHSKVMAWVAFDRAIRSAEAFGLEGPIDQWRNIRDAIHAQVCQSGFDASRNTFVQSYGSTDLDPSVLLIPQVGFLPPDDPRVLGTIQAIERSLMVDGLVLRYSTATDVDALPPGEGTFLPCSFWLADSLILSGERARGEALFEHLLTLCNDVGLLAEEYDARTGHMLGNFPQALTHMALINTARLLSIHPHEAKRASQQGGRPAAHAPMADPAETASTN